MSDWRAAIQHWIPPGITENRRWNSVDYRLHACAPQKLRKSLTKMETPRKGTPSKSRSFCHSLISTRPRKEFSTCEMSQLSRLKSCSVSPDQQRYMAKFPLPSLSCADIPSLEEPPPKAGNECSFPRLLSSLACPLWPPVRVTTGASYDFHRELDFSQQLLLRSLWDVSPLL